MVRLNTADAPAVVTALSRLRDSGILLGIWAVGAIASGIWLGIDHTEPAWDQGAHLSAALNHWQHVQQAQIFSREWWTQLWSLSPSYRGPCIYILTVPVLQLLGLGADQATAVNELFAAILIVAVYGLGRRIFDARTGLWSAGFCSLSPALTFNRVDYLLDYGLSALILAAYALLTFWWLALDGTPPSRELTAQPVTGQSQTIPGITWLWSVGFGGVLGLTILAKPTSILFLLMPMIWLLLRLLRRRLILGGCQFLLSLLIAFQIPSGWIQQNWLTILTTMVNSNAVGKSEGDPALTTWQGWAYYLQLLPDLISWPLLLVAIATSLLLGWSRLRRTSLPLVSRVLPQAEFGWQWLGSFACSLYLLCTLATNKDLRFILPITPILILMAVRLLLSVRMGPRSLLRWGIAGIAAALLILALFPLPGSSALTYRHTAMSSPRWPTQAVVNTLYAAEPYLKSNLGMLVDTPQIQAFNLNFYGKFANFQVSARQLGLSRKFISLDAQSLTWYLAKTGNQGSWVDHPIITPLRQQVETDPALSIYRSWLLPDQSQLHLYRRRQPSLVLEPLIVAPPNLTILRVENPKQAQAGTVVPITYELAGSGRDLRQGILLLTWKQVGGSQTWNHDHGVGFGQIALNSAKPLIAARITEHTAMQLPKTLMPGIYRLQGLYLNRKTQQTQLLSVPSSTLEVVASSTTSNSLQSRPPDLVTQLHELAQLLAQGKLDGLFERVGPMNQYDPTQDYLKVAELASAYRWQQNPEDLDAAYTVVLATVLQRKAESAITHLTRLTQIDSQNAYAWAYLAFVNLYQWRPHPAQAALEEVVKLRPDLPELKTLQLVTDVMKGNLVSVWQRSQQPNSRASNPK